MVRGVSGEGMFVVAICKAHKTGWGFAGSCRQLLETLTREMTEYRDIIAEQ